MRYIVALLLTAAPLHAQSVEEKIKALQAQNTTIVSILTEQAQQLNSMAAVQSRTNSNVMDLQEDVKFIKAQLAAMAQTQGVQFQTTAPSGGWDGSTTASRAQPATQQPTYNMTQMYSAPQTRRGFFARRGAGSCGS